MLDKSCAGMVLLGGAGCLNWGDAAEKRMAQIDQSQ